MRTTLTLDDDVAVQLERLRRSSDASLKDVVNEALRRGLREMHAPAKKRQPFRTPVIETGKPALSNVDNVAETLAVLENEDFK